MKTKIGVVSLGCDKNRVDTEVMLANLVDGGYEITQQPQDADVIIVNTCAFLESSRKEAIDTVLEMADFKDTGKCQKVIVTGCLGQKFGDEVIEYFDEVDAVVGTNDYDKICQIVEETLAGSRKQYKNPADTITFGKRILTTNPHVAYLKIGDGCNNFCSYCLIPYIRGRFRSVPMEQIVEHAKQLEQSGVKELILVAQDTTRYGEDLYGKRRLVDLLQQLSALQGIKWIRLLYCYPELTDEELIREIETNPKVCKYIDIPLQHVSQPILKAMNRRSTQQSIVQLFDRLANSSPKIQVRSTFICGFPGETDETHQEVQQFLQKYKLRNVGFFAYSKEEGTVSAKFTDQVPTRKKNSYVKKLYNVQHKVVQELNGSDVGKTYTCIVDSFSNMDGEQFVYAGRTEFMAPEIDGMVYIVSNKQLQIGDFVDVAITSALEYDLLGEVVE